MDKIVKASIDCIMGNIPGILSDIYSVTKYIIQVNNDFKNLASDIDTIVFLCNDLLKFYNEKPETFKNTYGNDTIQEVYKNLIEIQKKMIGYKNKNVIEKIFLKFSQILKNELENHIRIIKNILSLRSDIIINKHEDVFLKLEQFIEIMKEKEKKEMQKKIDNNDIYIYDKKEIENLYKHFPISFIEYENIELNKLKNIFRLSNKLKTCNEILKIHALSKDENNIYYLVSNHYDKTLNNYKNLNKINKIRIIENIVNALFYLHETCDIVHKGISLENIYYDEKSENAMLFGFENSRYNGNVSIKNINNLIKIPDVTNTKMTDIYLLGCLFEQLFDKNEFCEIVKKCKQENATDRSKITEIREDLQMILYPSPIYFFSQKEPAATYEEFTKNFGIFSKIEENRSICYLNNNTIELEYMIKLANSKDFGNLNAMVDLARYYRNINIDIAKEYYEKAKKGKSRRAIEELKNLENMKI
ncbi:hypothetical protein HDV06_001124 [Boothiomyces sp. JEL0866]|nr:hypothetical protein HDV06_001124 [Boothiomyces sp. JEL0866]